MVLTLLLVVAALRVYSSRVRSKHQVVIWIHSFYRDLVFARLILRQHVRRSNMPQVEIWTSSQCWMAKRRYALISCHAIGQESMEIPVLDVFATTLLENDERCGSRH